MQATLFVLCLTPRVFVASDSVLCDQTVRGKKLVDMFDILRAEDYPEQVQIIPAKGMHIGCVASGKGSSNQFLNDIYGSKNESKSAASSTVLKTSAHKATATPQAGKRDLMPLAKRRGGGGGRSGGGRTTRASSRKRRRKNHGGYGSSGM